MDLDHLMVFITNQIIKGDLQMVSDMEWGKNIIGMEVCNSKVDIKMVRNMDRGNLILRMEK